MSTTPVGATEPKAEGMDGVVGGDQPTSTNTGTADVSMPEKEEGAAAVEGGEGAAPGTGGNERVRGPPVTKEKIRFVAGHEDSSALTVDIPDEDHTLANALRHVLSCRQDVDFVGYSIPHPTQNKVSVRIQTTGNPPPSGRTVLVDGLNTLKAQCEHMLNVFDLAVPSALPPRVIEPTQPFPIKD